MAEPRTIAATRLLLVRNARDVIREPAVIHDHNDLGLSDQGLEQAARLRDRLIATGEFANATRLLSSNARKAIETANWSPYAPKSAGGGSYLIAVQRAARAFVEAVLSNEGGTIVVVTQTVPLRASLWAFLGLPFHASYLDCEITHTGITEWIADGWLPGTGQLKARLVRYNDHGHLLPGAWHDE